MNVLIVHAHPETGSFNAAMTRQAEATLAGAGHEVVVSDLYAMGFNPVSNRHNFMTVADSRTLRLQTEEAHASTHDGFVPELQAEMDKLARCDLLIFQFPIWWLGLPAILKGWVDRVFAVGRAYGGGRYFDRGVFQGKRAMCAVTVGGFRAAYSERGVYAEVEDILYPVHRGIFGFTGFTVIEPFVVYAPGRIETDERRRYLDRYHERLLDLDRARIIQPLATALYENGVLTAARD
ncbi:NAD(P)H dehydrogenase (quinone) [Enhydrobacter aerosaccus]|uniref:NAD(P)H dehydrogenase (Quinone) n=1 Tax=Enhydrobacter aerosaccus TaxID=225324 RepID=A0A1T4P9K5_9HYPH|nr:NAD(P)H-dependent oxidoreductase [Enhydrobacter aerosaccus]SJZ88214.1 NAD(P)H dehydrogenase (quinone) [Enhydrobacter aerosaccus]